MSPIVEKCIENIYLERDSGFKLSFETVAQLVREYGEDRLAERLVEEVPRTVPFEVVADLLSILVWNTSDNGSAIASAANAWLREAADTRKILIALNLDVIPFCSADEAKQVLMPIMEKHPLAGPHCARILANLGV